MAARIISIVEGHGEVAAVPLLIRRIADSLAIHDVQVDHPIRCPRYKLVKPGELERAVELAARKVEGGGQLLILIDAETDCPAELGPALTERAQKARADIPTAVVLAKMEYEAWFLGSIGSLQATVDPPPDPEAIRGAKERLAALTGDPYSETVDQPAYTSRFDMHQARQNCPSFDKCWRAVEWLLAKSRS